MTSAPLSIRSYTCSTATPPPPSRLPSPQHIHTTATMSHQRHLSHDPIKEPHSVSVKVLRYAKPHLPVFKISPSNKTKPPDYHDPRSYHNTHRPHRPPPLPNQTPTSPRVSPTKPLPQTHPPSSSVRSSTSPYHSARPTSAKHSAARSAQTTTSHLPHHQPNKSAMYESKRR